MKFESPQNNDSLEQEERQKNKKEYITSEEFEKQFQINNIEVDEHEIEFAKIEPHEKITDEYVVIIGGYSQGLEAYREEIQNLAKSGRNVIFINPYKGVKPSKEDLSRIKKFELPKTIQNKAGEVATLLDSMDIERADLAGHSQGASVGATLAAMRPGIADNLVLINPSGMHGEDSTFSLGIRSGKEWKNLKEEIERIPPPEMSEEERREHERRKERYEATEEASDKFDIRKMPWRYTREVPGIASADILPVLKELKTYSKTADEDEKTSIALVTAERDITTPHESIEKNIGLSDIDAPTEEISDEVRASIEKTFEEFIDSYAMYADKRAPHQAPTIELPGVIRQIVNEKHENK